MELGRVNKVDSTHKKKATGRLRVHVRVQFGEALCRRMLGMRGGGRGGEGGRGENRV